MNTSLGGIRWRLAMLLALLLALMAIAAGYALVQLRGVSLSVQSVYDDRVLPLFQLRKVFDTYVVDLPRVARDLRDGSLGSDQALGMLHTARREAREEWLRYKATYLVPREKLLIARAEPLLDASEKLLDRFALAVAHGTERPSAAELQATIQPMGNVLGELMALQADEAQAAAKAGRGAYDAALWAFVALLGLATVAGISIASLVAVGYARERRQGELEAERLSLCYSALSRTNQMIVRVRDEAQMFSEICRICVESRLARVAMLMLPDGADRFRITASAGPAETMMAGLELKLDPPGRDGPVAIALRHGRVDVCNDFARDVRLARFRSRAHEHGVRAMAAFPVRRGGTVVAALGLYVGEVGFFDAARLALLEEMTRDLSFALDNIDRDAAHAAAEREIEAGYERVQQIFNVMPVSITLASRRTGRLVLANTAAGERYGMAPEMMVGRTTAELKIGFNPAEREKFFARLDAHRSVRNFEAQVRNAHGEVLDLLTNAALIDYRGEPCALAVSLDITERKRRERAEQAQRDAETHSRAKTDFLSRMSHELRTPLNAVLGFSQLLQSNAAEPLTPRQREQVEAIRQAGWHLLALVNDVLDVSRIESGHLRVESRGVDLLALLDEVSELVRPQAERAGIQLSHHHGEGPAFVMADPVRLRQVLVNLMSNAIKYNRAGGVVSVEVERTGLRVGVSVADTGIGMTQEQLDSLFEPFNRLGREYSEIEGTGIGLVLTRQLLTLMDGELEVESEEGHGTTVHVTLRRADSAQPMGPRVPAGSTPGDADEDAPEGTVLYIEDNPINLLLVEQLLLRWPGIRLLQAETGEKGIELAQALQPDLVLLDMRLPDMSGPEVLEELRAHPLTSGLRVVALSASAMPDEVALARDGGAFDYWTKPLDFDRFTADLKRLLAKSTVS
ncbi:ATP-binding protein [Piscinibacter sp. HJYY11]|uniref:hybrid sensor histidine kinase/response regulator n=1 Tax=Piscinibacter sp. HJYY11 TaxID=2801333 RepID=UPI00191E5880|nr:ATP-binding protein [Piscinibacter sp. HJYY11]MBL0727150.1 response regulator [Piscinibacter sp. HJYY11]